MEGKEWCWNNGIVKEEKVAKYQKYINESELRALESRKLQVFQNFLGSL